MHWLLVAAGGGLPCGAVTGKADIINMIEDRLGDAEYNGIVG